MRWAALIALLIAGCATREGVPPHAGEGVRLTFLHTSDWHSRLLPYDLQLLATDRRLIERFAPDSPINEAGTNELVQIGGLARMATLIRRERGRSIDALWLDSGDCFQGAPIFNAFNGEVEVQALSRLGADAVVIGNHEFDKGVDNLALQLGRWATYPVLAANYRWERDRKGVEALARISRPYVILHARGLKIGVIGMANVSSLNSLGEGTNSLGASPLDEVEVVQSYIDLLAGQVDLIGITSHLGLRGDEDRLEDTEVIERTTGLDFVFGGHLHVVLDPPQIMLDRTGRPVVLTHSGAFMKYLGRLDVVVQDSGDPYYGYEIVSHRYELFPVDATVPDDTAMLRFLEPYILELNRAVDLTRIIAYAPNLIPRFGREKAGSELGNIAAEAMADRRGVQADFALTNTLGIRTDIIQGAITQDQMFNVFPFDNFITKMFMSGREICEMMTFIARRSAGRGCQPQAQFSDRVHVKLNCVNEAPECSFASGVAVRNQLIFDACLESGRDRAECDVTARELIDPVRIYEVAVNDYIAGGGSGFRVLKFNNAKVPTDISIRDAVSDRFQTYPACKQICLDACAGEEDPVARGQCVARVEAAPLKATGCEALTSCFDDVSHYLDRFCEGREERAPADLCRQAQAAAARYLERSCDGSEPLGSPCGIIADPPRAGANLSEAQLDSEAAGVLRWVMPMLRYCVVDVEAPPALPTRDTCPTVEQIFEQSAFAWERLEPATRERISQGAEHLDLLQLTSEQARDTLRAYGMPQPSPRCECRLDAGREVEAVCRELACVVGAADDRLETQLFETLPSDRDFERLFATDVCAQQARRTCAAGDLRGLEQDEEPN